ncbi:MAG: T3SS effector HopA1 family protein [Reinekea sp.]
MPIENVSPDYGRARIALETSRQTEHISQRGEIKGRTIEVNTPERHSNRIPSGSFQSMKKALVNRLKSLNCFSPSTLDDSPRRPSVSPHRPGVSPHRPGVSPARQQPDRFSASTSRTSGSTSTSSVDQAGARILEEMVALAKEVSKKARNGGITKRDINSAIRTNKPKDARPVSRLEQGILEETYKKLDNGSGPVRFNLATNDLASAGALAKNPKYPGVLEKNAVVIRNVHNKQSYKIQEDNARLTLSVEPSKVHSLLPKLARIVKNDHSVIAKVMAPARPQAESVVIYLPADFEKARQIANDLSNSFEGVMYDHIITGMHPVNKGIGYSENSKIDNTEHGACGSHANRIGIVMMEAFSDQSKGAFSNKLKKALFNHGYNPDAPAFLLKKT